MTMIRENTKRVTSTDDISSISGGGGVRLSALLSKHLGLSRRQAERMVLTERVTLFGKVVTLPSFELQHSSTNNYTNNTHAIKVDGKLITGIDNTIQLIHKEDLLRRGVVTPAVTTTTSTTNADETASTTATTRNIVESSSSASDEHPNIRIWLANKLSGELVTEDDPVGRPSLLERLSRGGVGKPSNNNNNKKQQQSSPIHLKPVGRLDMMTEGLIIITNDGRYARELELPANLFHRTYRARVHGRLTEGKLRAMRNGVTVRVDDTTSAANNDTNLKGGKSGSGSSRKSGIDKPSGEVVQTGRLMRYKGIKVAIERKNLNNSSRGRSGSDSGGGRGTNTWLRITCTEGKNRQLRRILESMGLDVTRLIRISYGDYDLNTIPPGMAIEVPYKRLDEMKKKGPLFVKNSDGKRRIRKKTESDTDEDVSSSKVEWINYS
jgi:23S rRNA pseudouridine2605 synthase